MSIVNKRGIDISDWQGNIDLAKVKKAGYQFVMIKIGIGSDSKDQDDSQFENNVKKAEKLGIPWGAYFYTYSLSSAQDKSELNHILRLLKGKKPTLPVAIDVEDADGYKKKHGGWTFDNVNRNAKYLLEGVKKAGYYPMLYTGYEEMQNYISKDVWSKYDLWVAHWAKKCWYTGKNLGMWQYGGEENYIDSPYISGIDGKIDKDIIYKDYPTIIKNGGYNGWKKSSTNKTPTTTKKITGQQLREKCCNIINSWVGAKEGDAVHAEILKIYNSQKNLDYKMGVHDPWCAATVSAVWIKAGISDYTGTSVNCGTFKDIAIKKGEWVENDAYAPKIGDAIIYYWSDDGKGDCDWGADHIGLVTKVSGKKFIVTEGNMGDGIVGKRTVEVNQRYIRGYITPKYDEIARKVNVSLDKPVAVTPEVTYKVRTNKTDWLPEVVGLRDYAGLLGKAITDVAIKVSSGTVQYRVKLIKGKWLPWVSGYNTKDSNNGYAGIRKPIDCIQIKYTDTSGKKYKIKYRVAPITQQYYDWQYGIETTNGQDGYAGSNNVYIDRLQITIVS